MLQHRRTLAKFVLIDDGDNDDTNYDTSDSEDEDEYLTESIGDSVSQLDYPYQQHHYNQDWNDNESCHQDRQQSNPSPAWSSTASNFSAHTTTSDESVQLEGRRIPAYFLETPSSARSTQLSSTGSHSSRRSSGIRRPRQSVQYKNHSHNLQPDSSSSPQSKLNQSQIYREFKVLKDTLSIQNGNQDNIRKLVCDNCTILMKATQVTLPDVLNDSIGLIADLAARNLIQQDTILHMLQNGLVFNLQNFLSLGGGFVPLTQVLINFAQSTPNCVPYMIELISNSTILKEFEVRFLDGNLKETRSIIDFYHVVTEILMSQICNQHQPQPLMPEVLLATGISKQTIESYSSISTMSKCISRALVNNVVSRCLDRSNMRDEDLLNKSLILLANSLKLAYIKFMNISSSSPSTSTNWIVQIMCGFRDSGIDGKLKLLGGTLQRLISASNSSEHSSQGVDAGPSATRILVKCQQFSEFYREYYEFVSTSCSHLLAEEPPLADRGQYNPW